MTFDFFLTDKKHTFLHFGPPFFKKGPITPRIYVRVFRQFILRVYSRDVSHAQILRIAHFARFVYI